jgi:xanthine dehydrogenase accessory factor
MQAVDKEVLGQVLTWLNAGESCWLATVVQTWGSSPRPVGSLLACNQAGDIVGSLSGGCVEEDLLAKLTKGELAAERAQFFQYGVTAEDTEKFGLPCGGHLYIVIEPQTPSAENITHFATLNEALNQRQCARRRVDLRNQTSTVEPVDTHAPLKWNADEQTLEHTYGPSLQLFIIGAGMVSKYLATMAQMLDYEVTVCDPREDLLQSFGVDNVQLIADMPDDAVRAHAKDQSSAIVALTHDPRIDDMGLMEALTTDAFYIGAMGSSRTSASRRERLSALDVSPDDLDKLHAPIGLPIGSKTPPEIAIAILAEITAVQKQRLPEVAGALAAASAG